MTANYSVQRQEAARRHAVVLYSKEISQKEIAKRLGVSQSIISRWLAEPESRSLLARIREEAREAVADMAVADKIRRILDAQTMIDGIDALLESRIKAGIQTPPHDRLPGEETGQLAIKRKTTTITQGSGANARTTVIVELEGAFDASVHQQRRQWQEYVAKELNELQQTTRVLHSGRVDGTIKKLNVGGLTDEELERLEEIRERAVAEGMAQ